MTNSKPMTLPDDRGRFGDFGGKFVPETLMAALLELEDAYREARPRITTLSDWGSASRNIGRQDTWSPWTGRSKDCRGAPVNPLTGASLQD